MLSLISFVIILFFKITDNKALLEIYVLAMMQNIVKMKRKAVEQAETKAIEAAHLVKAIKMETEANRINSQIEISPHR